MKWYAWVIIVLVVALAVLSFLYTGARDKIRESKRYDSLQDAAEREEFIKHTIEILVLKSEAERYKDELDSIMVSAAKSQGALKTQLRALKKRYVVDTLHLTVADTIVVKQDSLIADMEAEKAATKVSTDALIGTLETKAQLSESEVSKWAGRYQASEANRAEDQKQFKRQRRRERIAEGLVIVGVVILSL